jgi:hypothetical protein
MIDRNNKRTSIEPSMLERFVLEQNILGACLLERGYGLVADILSSKNFSRPDYSIGHFFDHQKFFGFFETSYPTKLIDIRTMCHAFPEERDYLVSLTCGVCSASNLSHHAVLLLEIDIRQKFIKLLSECASVVSTSLSTRCAVHEILVELNDADNDIFDLIESGAIHLSHVSADEALLRHVRDFQQNVDSRILRMKQMRSIDNLMRNLLDVSRKKNDPLAKATIAHLVGLMKVVLSQEKIDGNFASQVFRIRPT